MRPKTTLQKNQNRPTVHVAQTKKKVVWVCIFIFGEEKQPNGKRRLRGHVLTSYLIAAFCRNFYTWQKVKVVAKLWTWRKKPSELVSFQDIHVFPVFHKLPLSPKRLRKPKSTELLQYSFSFTLGIIIYQHVNKALLEDVGPRVGVPMNIFYPQMTKILNFVLMFDFTKTVLICK